MGVSEATGTDVQVGLAPCVGLDVAAQVRVAVARSVWGAEGVKVGTSVGGSGGRGVNVGVVVGVLVRVGVRLGMLAANGKKT